MSVETTRPTWAANAEAAILELRDVEGASIQMDGDEIREIHVLSTSTRPPKQIVRDVQTLLLTRFHRSIDHRVVSVAFTQEPRAAAATQPAPAPAPVAPPVPARTDERIRFVSVNLYVSGRRVQAQVELQWKGLTRMGSASGWGTREGALKLVGQAALGAIQEFLEGDLALNLEGIERRSLGRSEVVLAVVDLLAHREQKTLVGCCTVEDDAEQAVVLAVLDALNRIVGGLQTKEPTEYVLRPTST